jgi:hypothetical protein
MAVDLELKDEPTLSQPRVLFERHYAAGPITIANYDASGDGRMFVMVTNETESTHLNLVLNWAEELKRIAAPR